MSTPEAKPKTENANPAAEPGQPEGGGRVLEPNTSVPQDKDVPNTSVPQDNT
jgi:hypothetical protein